MPALDPKARARNLLAYAPIAPSHFVTIVTDSRVTIASRNPDLGQGIVVRNDVVRNDVGGKLGVHLMRSEVIVKRLTSKLRATERPAAGGWPRRFLAPTEIALFLALSMFSSQPMGAADWPQWQGPNRIRHSNENGLLQQWPAPGPRQIWTADNLGTGYGSPAVAGGSIYLQGARGDSSYVIALQRSNGKELWSRALGPVETKMRTNRGAGPRGTPTVDGDRLYALTENGDLACLKTDGEILWQRNILKDFGGAQLQWLVSESPLVDGPHLVVTPGGPGAGMAKLDKMTGKTIWTSRDLSEPAAYSSIAVAEVEGVRTYLTFTASAGVGVRASDGKLMFRYPNAANGVANVATPVYADGKVFFASGYGTGGGLLKLTVKDGEVAATEVYFTKEMKNHHGGMVLVNGYLYGYNDLILTCLEFATGKMMWRDRSVGKGSVTYADGRLYLQSEGNIVGLAEATPEGYREKGRFEIPDKGQPSWAHPVISDGRLYVRNQDTLLAYDIKAKGASE